jgi:DNA-binding NarL/FixJ family response regulator
MSMRAEILALRALAMACAGQGERAMKVASHAEEASGASEVRVLVATARAVMSIARGDESAFAEASAALGVARTHFNVEGIVCACRAFPALAAMLYEAPTTREQVAELLTASKDASLLKSLDDGTDAAGGSWESLSRREREVLALVSQGMTNAEVAARLYVAEATVKVHMRHVLEKLGVKTRTEAALRVPYYARKPQ